MSPLTWEKVKGTMLLGRYSVAYLHDLKPQAMLENVTCTPWVSIKDIALKVFFSLTDVHMTALDLKADQS